jgi:hypothetical protein
MAIRREILVTGCPRSGASMITAALTACGAFGGEMSKRGMYSNDRIREELMVPYLMQLGCDPEGRLNLPVTDDLLIPQNWHRKVWDILVQQGYNGTAWVYKDARIALTWPVWEHAFPNAKWVIIRRRTGDIVQSAMKTGYMVERDTEEEWKEWVRQYNNKFVEMISSGLNCKVIWPERMVHGDYKQLYELCEWLGLKWNKEALNYMEPLLWGSRKKEKI